MDIRIQYTGPVSVDAAYTLAPLSNMLIEELGVPVTTERLPAKKDVKDGGLVIGLTIIGVTLEAVSTAISVIQYWNERNKAYTVTIKHGDIETAISRLSKDELLIVLDSLNKSQLPLHILISI